MLHSQSKLLQEWAFRYHYTDFLLEGSSCSSEGKRPFPSPKGGGGGGEQQGHCTEPLSQLSPARGMQKPCPLPKANSSPGSCRNRILRGVRANVCLQSLINYHVALSNDELS